jgi:hypothetical protein
MLIVLNLGMQFHENPAVITWWCGRFERALSWFTPSKRRLILTVGAIYIGIKEPLSEMQDSDIPITIDMLSQACVVLALFTMLWFIYRFSVKFSALPTPIRRHPQIALHFLFWIFLAIVWVTPSSAGRLHAILIGIGFTLPFLIWRCGYLLQSGQNGRVTNTSFSDHLLYLWPVFGGSETPYGKGNDFLSRFEAKNNQDLARSQLSGIKLLLLALCWRVASKLMGVAFYGADSIGGIPELSALVKLGSAAHISASWASLYCELIYQVFEHAAKGHAIIGILRLFGFNVFRNTYKPLLAESIVEFWNRYYYYFKELMSVFFFLPTFMSLGTLLKKWPSIRLFIAVFAAAFVGNMYYHIIEKEDLLVSGRVFDAAYSLRSRFFYCFLLAIGIFISMWRIQQRGNQAISTSMWARGMRMFGVWTFFSLIFIWNVKVKYGCDFITRMEFFFNLFGF